MKETSSGGGCFPVLFTLALMVGFGWITIPSMEISTRSLDQVKNEVQSIEGVKINTSDTGIELELKRDTEAIGTEQESSEGGGDFYEE